MYKIFENIAQFILNVIIVIIFLMVAIVGYNYVQLKILNKDYTNFFGYTVFEISTGSMAKPLNVYDIIVVEITQDVKVGDIITYKNENNELITHRIMQIGEDKIITKGDANNTEDKPITQDAIIGKIISVYPKLGVWTKVFSEPNVLISVFITLILIGLATSKDVQEKQKIKKGKEDD